MYPGLKIKNELYICKKLKWYQWILQKLHIKNYWKKIEGVKFVGVEINDEEKRKTNRIH